MAYKNKKEDNIERFANSNATLPSDIDMERNFLSFILTDNNIIADCRDLISGEDFYYPKHQEIYEAFMQLYSSQELTADLNLLSKSLINKGVFEDSASAKNFINELLDPKVMANHMYALKYAEEIHELALQRKLVKTSWEVPYILEKVSKGELDMEQAVNEIEARMFAVTQEDKEKKRGLVEIGSCVDDFSRRIENLSSGEVMPNGTPTGIESLDNIISGFKPGDLVVLAARPAQGKSALVLNIAFHVAAFSKLPVAFYSLEMSAEQLTDRLIASVARVNLKEFNTLYYRYNDDGYENPNTKKEVKERLVRETKRLLEAKEYVKNIPLLIEDNPSVSLLDITASARRLSMECTRRYGAPLGMIIIDYLQLMSPSSKSKNASREQEVAEMSRGLKILAKELNVPIMALSQLSRQVESRADKRPQLSDLRECVTGDTLVYLADGTTKAIKDLVGATPEVINIDKNQKIQQTQSEVVWKVGKKDVYKVELESGKTFTATKEHRVLGFSDWITVENLEVGTFIGTPRVLPVPTKIVTQYSDDRIAWLGQMIGDGSYLDRQPLRYVSSLPENLEFMTRVAQEEFSMKVKEYKRDGSIQLVFIDSENRWNPQDANKWLRELGIWDTGGPQKHLPEFCFQLNEKQTKVLLQHLWATDGSITVQKSKNKKRVSILFSSSSRQLIDDIGLLLLRFGIQSRVKLIKNTKTENGSDYYDLMITGKENQEKFLKEIGAFGSKKEQLQSALDLLNDIKENTNVDVIPNKNKSLENTVNSPIFWDRVKNIEFIGEEDVYDITVPNGSSWIMNGIFSHNSGAIEQDADIVMFIYRPHAGARAMGADDEDEVRCKKLQGEVIVSKHRSGPTGEAHVIIDDNFTKFSGIPPRVRVIGIEAYIQEYYENVYKKGNLYFGVPDAEVILEEFKGKSVSHVESISEESSLLTSFEDKEDLSDEIEDKNFNSMIDGISDSDDDEDEEYFNSILKKKVSGDSGNLLADFMDD